MLEQAKPPIPLVSSHSRRNDASRLPQTSCPKRIMTGSLSSNRDFDFWLRLFFVVRNRWRAKGLELHEIFGEKQVQSPVQRHSQLLLEPWELAEIDSAPQPPGNEAREVNAENVSYAGAPADGSELSNGLERKEGERFLVHHGDQVLGQCLSLPQGVLGRRGMWA